MLPGFYFLSLSDAVTNHAAFVDNPRWERTWLPLFANGGGDFLAVNASGGTAESAAAVYHFRIEQSEHPMEYRSIASMLATVSAAYEEGLFYVEAGYLEMRDEAFAVLAARLNPDVPWWND